jgi:hypothetical protein
VLFCQLLHLEPRLCHFDTERFYFTGPGNRTAIVIGQHHDRLSLQRRIERALARNIEIVAIDQCNGHGKA